MKRSGVIIGLYCCGASFKLRERDFVFRVVWMRGPRFRLSDHGADLGGFWVGVDIFGDVGGDLQSAVDVVVDE